MLWLFRCIRWLLRWLQCLDNRLNPTEPPPPTCPIGWQPSALAPVYCGVRDYGPVEGAPGPCRVFFPGLDGAVFDAPILEGCGRYPLVLFAHGHCDETEHYKKWYHLPAQLARSGYVVVAPEMPSISTHPSADDHPALARMAEIVAWMREGWAHRDVLLPHQRQVSQAILMNRDTDSEFLPRLFCQVSTAEALICLVEQPDPA